MRKPRHGLPRGNSGLPGVEAWGSEPRRPDSERALVVDSKETSRRASRERAENESTSKRRLHGRSSYEQGRSAGKLMVCHRLLEVLLYGTGLPRRSSQVT